MKYFSNDQLVRILNTTYNDLDGVLCVVVGTSNTNWDYPTYFIKKACNTKMV